MDGPKNREVPAINDEVVIFRRIYDYHDFKKRLPSFADPINRYSFVVNAFVAASKLQR